MPVHREQLAKDLGNRLGLEYRTERTKEGSIFGYCLCVDSLHPQANPGFNPNDWEGCWVIFDEADQVFWHLLNSNTCQSNRPAILASLAQLLNMADKIIMASADLNRVCFEYVQGLMEKRVEQYLIVNEWQHPIRPCYVFEKPQDLFAQLKHCRDKGQRLMVHTGGQKDKSKWGTLNLERMLKKLYPDLKILRIDSASVADPAHPAYGCMANISAVVTMYDVVICSPTVETGVSVNGDHFDGVFCFASGSQTVDAIGQTLERVRADVPRYLWSSKRAQFSKIGSGSINPWALMNREKSLVKLTKSLNEADNYSAYHFDIQSTNLLCWGKFSAYHNQGFDTYRESIYKLLERNGFSILSPIELQDLHDGKDESNTESSETTYGGTHTIPDMTEDGVTPAEVLSGGESSEADDLKTKMDIALRGAEAFKDMAETSAKQGHAEYCEKVSNTPVVDDVIYRKLKDQRTKTESERLSVKATEISKRYATEDISPALVDRDSDYKWHGQLRLHYYLMRSETLVKERDLDRAHSLAKCNGKIFSPDLNRACLSPQVKLLKDYARLQDWLTPGRILTSEDPELKAWHQKMCKGARDIKKIAGITINSDTEAKGNSPIAVLKRFLKMLGLKLECVGVINDGGEQIKQFRLPTLDPDGRDAIFSRWDALTLEPPPSNAMGDS